jgi:hypothetical protein
MILDGTTAGNIPVVMETPANRIFDYNALKRFQVSEKSLPAGSTVINRPDTFYHKYKIYIRITISVFVVLSILVIITDISAS